MRFTSVLLAATAITIAASAHADLKLPRVSPSASATQTIGLTDFSVTYSRPGVKGRPIWGALVPYDKPWRTGANEATTFTTSTPITFGGKPLAAGSYALVTVPGHDDWVVALNSGKELWSKNDYKESEDVMRVSARPKSGPPQEWLSFSFENLTPNSGDLVLRWEKLSVAVPITIDVNAMATENINKAIAEAKPDEWRPYYQAANWAFTAEPVPAEGKVWLDKSLAIQKNYQNLNLLARWQKKDGKTKEAIATGKQAIAAGKASKDEVDVAPTEKLVAEWSAQ